MSKIALSSNASGTGVFTIESPDSDTDRTLTLPDVSGTVVSENASGNVDVTGDITSNGNAVITTQSPQLGRRNLIINGDMRVAQRGTSSSVGFETFMADRFRAQLEGLGAFTLSQDTNAPDGFNFSSKLTCNTADASPAASDLLIAGFRFEGQDLQHLQYGTASAKKVTVSFWVKSNKTGTFVCALLNVLSSPLRKIVKSYTIDSADTWEYKTITIDGDTAYSISNSSNRTIDLTWWLGGGSDFSGTSTPSGWADNDNAVTLTNQTVNLADAVNNYWQITGVQLEVGDVATPFEHRSYGEELTLCKRYFETMLASSNSFRSVIMGSAYGSSTASNYFEVEKRASGTLSLYDYNATLASNPTSRLEYNSIGTTSGYFISAANIITQKTFFIVSVTNTGLNGMAVFKWTLDAEL